MQALLPGPVELPRHTMSYHAMLCSPIWPIMDRGNYQNAGASGGVSPHFRLGSRFGRGDLGALDAELSRLLLSSVSLVNRKPAPSVSVCEH